MSHLSNLRKNVIEWNNRYPLDRLYRKQHNIGFGSSEHRVINQIDIYFEWLEDRLYEEAIEKAQVELKEEKDLEKGIWLKRREDKISSEEEMDLFNKIDTSKMIKE